MKYCCWRRDHSHAYYSRSESPLSSLWLVASTPTTSGRVDCQVCLFGSRINALSETTWRLLQLACPILWHRETEKGVGGWSSVKACSLCHASGQTRTWFRVTFCHYQCRISLCRAYCTVQQRQIVCDSSKSVSVLVTETSLSLSIICPHRNAYIASDAACCYAWHRRVVCVGRCVCWSWAWVPHKRLDWVRCRLGCGLLWSKETCACIRCGSGSPHEGGNTWACPCLRCQ